MYLSCNPEAKRDPENPVFTKVSGEFVLIPTPLSIMYCTPTQIKELVRGSVEETLNELLEAEAEKLTQAARYERNEQRRGYQSGHYTRNLTTTSGDVTLKVPKLKGISFETAIIERYRRRESSEEKALIEMYLAGVSVRRVEDIIGALWGSKVSPPPPSAS